MSLNLLASPDVSPRAYRDIAYQLKEYLERTGSPSRTFKVHVENPGVGDAENWTSKPNLYAGIGQARHTRYSWRGLFLPHWVTDVDHMSQCDACQTACSGCIVACTAASASTMSPPRERKRRR
ncbi:hypothetical protein VTG60DRAFT_2814 [Thermothelomyces hinnuleus]